MMMNVSKNKAFLIAGVAVLGLGVGAYFLFFRQKKGAYNPNDTNLNANPAAAADYRKQLNAFSKSQKLKDTTRSLLATMNQRGKINKEQVKNLLYNNIPDDEHMKILKGYFRCHLYQGNLLSVNDKRMDLVGWLQESLSSDDFEDLLGKYPSLNYRINC